MKQEETQGKEAFKKELVKLHEGLGNFQMYIARKSSPARFEGEEYEAVNAVLELIEKETEALR